MSENEDTQDQGLTDPQEPGKVTGYRKVPQSSLNLVNEIKAHENSLGELVKRVRKHFDQVHDLDDATDRLFENNFEEWADATDDLDEAVRQLQSGYMWLVRSIMQPSSKLKFRETYRD